MYLVGRIPSGNVLAVYQVSGGTVRLTEQPVYGSARVGQRQVDLAVGAAPAATEVYTRRLGDRRYELSDHLGNVRVTVLDRKKVVGSYYEPVVQYSAAYYAFGQEMEGRLNQVGENYRYGYNGKEKDRNGEWGLTNYDFGARIYNPAIAKFLSVDPKYKNYPNQSPYSSFNNSPILYNDPTGESGEVTINKNTKTLTVRSTIIFYGDAASTELAKQTAKSIQDQWNAASGKVNVNGTEYNVKFEIHGEYRMENVLPVFGSLLGGEIANNKDIKNNYIRVESATDYAWNKATSYMDDEGSNTGFWSTEQMEASGGTTPTHEYGHGIGIGHLYEKSGNRDQSPSIMMTMFSYWLVKPVYQNKDGYVDISKRKVTQKNIDDLGLDKLKYDKGGKANLGKLTNQYHGKPKKD